MNKKTVTILIIVAAILIGGIAVAVASLYSSHEKDVETVNDASHFLSKHKLIEAVPSDAAIVMCFKDFGRACDILGDSLTIFGELASNKFDKIAAIEVGGLKKCPTIMSVHYSKDMPPLLVIEARKAIADSSADLRRLLTTADSSGLYTRINGDLVLISSSETVLKSSIRHQDEGHSILEAQGFIEIASKDVATNDDVIFFSNAYTGNIIDAFFSKKHRKASGFIRDLAKWTAFSVSGKSNSQVMMKGSMLYSNEPSYYLNTLSHSGLSKVGITDAVPGNVDFILDIPIGNINSYIKAYRNYLDSRSRLDKYESSLREQKKERGLTAEEWAQSLGIKEIALVNLLIDSKIRQVLMLRPGTKLSTESVSAMTCQGFARSIFGDIFIADDESTCSLVGGWIIVGAADCVAKYSDTSFLKETLADRMKSEGLDRLPEKNCRAWMYHSLSEDPNLLNANFSQEMARGIRNILKGATYVPATLSVLDEGGELSLKLCVDRVLVSKGTVALSSARDTTIVIPEGPFKVRNCATGKINTLYQNSHLSICLRDENGKDVWGVPFKSKIRGYVQEVDYYNNGKIQYLFASGSKMYLIDRLGRFVSGFPAETGKGIAAGPTVYDFTGAKGYTAMLLHNDNTVGYYDLHGKQVPSWKGIRADETIKSLPELLEGNGKRYWVVRTSFQTMVFPFDGGDPLVKGEGNKMIRPDSKVELTDKGFSAVCYDGKDRTFK